MAELKITAANFENEILHSDKPVLLDFYADWCGPCKMLSPVLHELAEEKSGTLKVGKVNVDEQMELAMRFQVSSIPMLVVFKDGKAVAKSVGYRPKAEITAMVQEGTGAPGDVLEAAEQKIYAIRRGRSAQSMATIQVVLQEVMEHLAELSAQGGKTLPGLSTGFSAVDGKINGLNKSDLLLLAARPGMGKTSMALNVALNAAKESGQTVAVFSLEMSRDQLVTRLLASEGLIENTRLISGDLRESDWVKIAEGASSLSRLDIRIEGISSAPAAPAQQQGHQHNGQNNGR